MNFQNQIILILLKILLHFFQHKSNLNEKCRYLCTVDMYFLKLDLLLFIII